MRHLVTAASVLLLLCTAVMAMAAEETVQPPAILSIIPGQGAPGTTVVISGSGFGEQTSAFLGVNEIPAKLLTPRQLSFEIPQLDTGNYALYLQQPNGAASKAYAFHVLPLKPLVTSVSPDSISFCAAGDERVISVKGRNFLEGAQLLLDNAAVRSRRISPEEMSFIAPQIPGGLHQVQVKNPEETVSGAYALLVTTRPEIQSVSQGDDYVNYYELNISGINFQQGSSLIVDGRKLQSGYAIPGERDQLRFISCNRLVYHRYPYDPSIKSFNLIVVNPNGEESAPLTVSAP